MNRATIASLAVAAVVGTTAGVALAVSTGDEPTGDRRTATSSASGTPAASDPTDPATGGGTGAQGGLLYFADGAIHDGDASVPVPDSIDDSLLMALARVDGGWLLVQSGDGEGLDTATYVAADGSAWRIGGLTGRWDLTPDRTGVYYDTATAVKRATFADRSAEVVDLLGGGETPDFMTLANRAPGVAWSAEGLVTAWRDAGSVRLVATDLVTLAHTVLGIEDVSLPHSGADGSVLVSEFDNPDYSPTSPVGSCATGGAVEEASPTAWWQECERGAVTSEPFSPDGASLLLGETTGDGPPGSSLVVVDPRTGEVQHRLDPGGYFVSAAWADSPGVVVALTADDESGLQQLSTCEVASGDCEPVVQVEGSVVLGTVG